MKIKWLDTFEVEVIDQFNEETDNIDECHNEVIVVDTTVEIDIIKDDGDYVDIQFGDGSMITHLHRSTFVEITGDEKSTISVKNHYGNGECPECNVNIPEDAKVGDKCSCGRHTFVNTFKKITIGYVVQVYKTFPNGTHVCTGQQFVAGEVTYESTEYGDILADIDTLKEVYCPFEMEQPKHMPFPDNSVPDNPVKNSYEDGACPDCSQDIPDDVAEGGECSNCGHVFYKE